ncbi:MAG: type I-B CRISPR-associated protein Cas7/Csh2 [bacterium]
MDIPSNLITQNSDILFIYDARQTNPNGDPDDENKPRMDYESSRNLVSDVRLKRYIRDYLQDYRGQDIFVAKVDNKALSVTERLEMLFLACQENDYSRNLNLTKLERKHINWLLSQLVDVRFFGATMPIKAKEGAGASATFTGPIQFNWGYSLNRVELLDSSSITSHFSSEAEKAQGAIGKDWRVYYSLIAFHGIISARRAERTSLNKDDILLFDESIIRSIPLEATTRSKIGQTPRLYIRVEYKDNQTFLGDLRDQIVLDKTDGLRSIADFHLDVTRLSCLLKKQISKISRILFWQHADLKISGWGGGDYFHDKIEFMGA